MCETGVHWRVFDPRENILLQVKMLHGEKETVKPDDFLKLKIKYLK